MLVIINDFLTREEDYKMKETMQKILEFRDERGWAPYHTPDNLAKFISIEAAELLECFQWNSEFDPTHVNEELADVLIYCLQMTDVLGVDAKEIIFEKLEKNAIKYPVKK